jgi:hypothetical protein
MVKEEKRDMGQVEVKSMGGEETRARVEILKDLVWGMVRITIKVLEVEQVLDLVRVVIKDLDKVKIKYKDKEEAKDMDKLGIQEMDKEEIRDVRQVEVKTMDRDETRVEILMDLVLGYFRTIIKALEVEQVLDLVRVAIRDLGVEQVWDLGRAVIRVETVGLECTVCLPQENCLEVAVLRVQEDLLGGS